MNHFLIICSYLLLSKCAICQISCDSILPNFTGKCIAYLDENDSMSYNVQNYLNGTMTSEYSYYYNGRLIRTQKFKDSASFSWEYKSFSSTGNMLSEYSLINGSGQIQKYYSDGTTQFKGRLKNQKTKGSWKYYDDDGELLAKVRAKKLIQVKCFSFRDLNECFFTNCNLLKAYSKGDYAGEIIVDSNQFYQKPHGFIENFDWSDSTQTKMWISTYGDTLLTALPEKDKMIGLVYSSTYDPNKRYKIYLYFKPIVPYGTILKGRDAEKYLYVNGVSGWYLSNGNWVFGESRVSYSSDRMIQAEGSALHGIFILRE